MDDHSKFSRSHTPLTLATAAKNSSLSHFWHHWNLLTVFKCVNSKYDQKPDSWLWESHLKLANSAAQIDEQKTEMAHFMIKTFLILHWN